MSSNDDALHGLIGEMVLVLAPLVEAAQVPADLARLLVDLGWTASSIPTPLLDLAAAGANLIGGLSADPGEIPTQQMLADIARLVGAIDAIRTRPDSAFPSGIDIASFKRTIGRDLLDYCVVDHALRRRFKVGRLLQLAGIIQLIDIPARGLRQAYLKRHIEWGKVGTLLTDPVSGFREAYAWNAATTQLKPLLGDIASLFEAFGLDLSFFELTADQLAFANTGAIQPLAEDLGIALDLNEALGVPPGSQAGVQLVVRAATAARGPAIAFMPYAQLNTSASTADDSIVSVSIKGADLTQDLAITLAPGKSPLLESGFLGAQTVAPTSTQFQVDLRIPLQPERILLGTADGSRVSLHTVTASAGAALLPGQQVDVFAELDFQDALVAVKPGPGETDSFLADLLGPVGISAKFSFGLRLSSVTGFHLTGSDGLEARFPVGVHLGPVDVQAVTLALATNGQDVELRVGAVVVGSIGPVGIVIDRLGFTLTARFPDPPTGNLGNVDLQFSFKPPSGIGLSVDAQGVVTGGGFLFHDEAQQLYAGEMHLQFEGILVKAVGLLATRLPDGKPGFSLLVIVSADFPPVQLGLGFMLVGVGGLLGINRTVAVEALRAGLKTGALGAVLSPPDPEASAGQLVATLAGLFPPASGRHVFAPTARIVWGSPTLITIDLCLVLELPAPVRLVVLGRLRAVLPDEQQAIVRIQVDMLGVINFDRGEAAVDATLVDSRLAQFALTGDMALRMSWGEQSSFLLAVGGFHPRFAAPPGFPALQRVAVALAGGDNPKLRLEAYLALTSNTVQFGARVDLAARAGSFSIAGFLSFDALVTLAPLAFVVDIAAKLAVKAGGHTLFSVSLALTLSGPRPWRARGRASFSILFFDVSFGFDVTIGDDAPIVLPAPVDVAALVLAAFADARSWSAQLPASAAALVTLRALEPGTAVLAHPLATLQVRQRVAPLERTLERFGTSAPSGARRFAINPVATIGGVRTRLTGLQDHFAPAQFFALSDDAKLSAPSFEAMPSGAALGTEDFATGTAVSVRVDYEQLLLTAVGVPEPRRQSVVMPGDVFATLTATPPQRPPAFALRDVP